jgi:dTDP-4-amino-4,6-dideoxygalactose transaminase/lipopolysaccharide/colanic/teichoic acid biosynthesis glycosyltransferase
MHVETRIRLCGAAAPLRGGLLRSHRTRRFALKRLIDVCGASIALLLSAPVLLVVALAIWLFNGRPILYRSKRVGRFGEPFLMVKFRSMVPGADLQGNGAIQSQDPRVTRLGKLLRATKLDELPQLFNVLMGEMSLVGPRPELWRYAGSFQGERQQILDLRPGLTDWATLVNFDEFLLLSSVANADREYVDRIRPVKIALQLKYLREMNLRTDIRVLLHTAIKLVVRRWLPSELRKFRQTLKGSLMEAIQEKSQLHTVPFCLPDVTEDAIEEVVSVLRSGWMTTGPQVGELEAALGRFVGSKHVLAVNSCTAGLHLALAGLGIGPGDEVITTPLTFCSTINVILQVGAVPILADIGPDLNIDPRSIARLITPRTRAIIPVHIAGLPCNMEAIWELAQTHNLKVIEDAAHATGASYRGVRIGGGQSDAVAFSFYATKNLSTGEGGAVVTPSEELYDRMRILCLHGISRDAWNRYSEKGNWHYDVVECGFKYNMSDIMGAIGIHQLARLDEMNARRAEIAQVYNQAFAALPEFQIPAGGVLGEHAWHLYILRLNLDRLVIDRARFFNEMRERGVNCSVHFIPIPLHPYYHDRLEMRAPCTAALDEYPRLLTLPLYSAMTDSDVARVIEVVCEVGARFKMQTPVAFPELV